MSDDLDTGAEKTWCTGCGNFGILASMKKAVKELEERDISRDRLVISTGIGCHGKIFDYLNLSGIYSLHGREVASAQGIKLGNPDLKIIAFGGDGDCYGEGLAHLLFAAKRNIDITVIVHNNGAYALTTGQASPTSPKGFKGPATPEGSVEPPIEPLGLLLSAGATFVARGYAGKVEHLSNLIVQAVEHPGFAHIDVLQPSVVFTDRYDEYNDKVEELKEVKKTRMDAMELAGISDRLPVGVFYREEKSTYDRELLGEGNPVEDRMSDEKRFEVIKRSMEM
ncbi:MAG: thiamine pyrophosphate-dependent enzyme [Thermoplasmata archaeon]